MKNNAHPQYHIGIYGRSNVGKSSLINSILGQDHAIVSPLAGTTTDPVRKIIELPNIGPLVFIDTAGIDDTTEIGHLRIKKTIDTIPQIDLAIIVIINNTINQHEQNLIDQISDYGTPYFFVHNKSEIEALSPQTSHQIQQTHHTDCLNFSCITPDVNTLSTYIHKHLPVKSNQQKSLLGSLVKHGDIVLLITPIDTEAPEGRLILPQVQTIRDTLDNDCVAIVLKEREVDTFLRNTQIKPAIAISDTQVILKADASVPKNIPLTGFSILLAHHKGDFANYLLGTPKINELKDGDRILMLESCTHHVSCDDIGRVKIPRWISNFTGKQLHFDVVSGLNALPHDINQYAMLIQCGGCMISRKQIINRLKPALQANIPVSNYGMTIAYVQGVYNRVIAPFTKSQSPELYL